MEPQFVEIILVESYKKFNEENTSKDPFDKDENENKTKLMCSCFIYWSNLIVFLCVFMDFSFILAG